MKLLSTSKFRPEQTFNEIDPLRFYIGIFLGIFSAFIIYSFAFVVFEAFRMMTKTEDCSFWIVSNAEMRFFKIFMALLSLILAQSVTMVFWWNKPRNIYSKYDYKRKININNIRGFSWYFISWFVRLATIIGIYFIITGNHT